MFQSVSRKPATIRREFGRQCLAMATGSMAACALQLRLTERLLAQGSDPQHRALVCLFLDGGNDSFNMLTPYETGEFADYLSVRGDPAAGGIALARDAVLPITTSAGRSFGMHPAMTEMKSLYDAGDLAFVANVGSLIEPTDMSDYESETRLPLGLFSHSDFVRHWQTSLPQSRSAATGWGGRVADILTDPSRRSDPIAMSLAVDVVNTFQKAVYANPYIVSSYGAIEHASYASNWGPDLIFRGAFDEVLARPDANLLRQTYGGATRQAIDAAALYNEATNAVSFETTFPSSYLAAKLEQVARAVASAETLGHQKQVFFISFGGWDHHAGLLTPQNDMLRTVSEALGAFQACLSELSLADRVVTFSASDFGRTLAGNGQGSDHGWGGNQFVIGGAVAGGDVYGDYPASLATDNPLDVGRGRLIPTTSVDEYAAELAMWMGIGNNGDLETILPNIRNFYASGAGSPPLGFLL